MEEAREKIELFRNYYLVCFRSFDQDPYSPTHLEPLNMYIIVFREGTLSVKSPVQLRYALSSNVVGLVSFPPDTTSPECPPADHTAQRLHQRNIRLDFVRPH